MPVSGMPLQAALKGLFATNKASAATSCIRDDMPTPRQSQLLTEHQSNAPCPMSWGLCKERCCGLHTRYNTTSTKSSALDDTAQCNIPTSGAGGNTHELMLSIWVWEDVRPEAGS